MTYFNGDGCGSRIVRDHAGHCRELQVRLEVLVPDCESADVYQATGPLAGTPDSPAAGPRRFRRRHRRRWLGQIGLQLKRRLWEQDDQIYGGRWWTDRRFDFIEQTHCCRYPLTDRRTRAPVRASSGRRR
jgi:hypothetical protein